MVWEAIKLTGLTGTIFGALSYGYSKVHFILFAFAVLLLILAFINNIDVVQKEY